jgi:hypothetical protein
MDQYPFRSYQVRFAETFHGTRRPARLILAVFALLLATNGTAAAQLPEEFTNLKVLPEDIDQRTLINYMRSFALGLGVRCSTCHVGEENQPLSEYDFAADDKEMKIRARTMMRMVDAINNDHLSDLEDRDESNEVTCATCHRGVSTPRMLPDVLAAVYEEEGIDQAITQYRQMRDRYYGSYSYDFGERALNDVANTVSNVSLSDAMLILELNDEFFPNSTGIYYMMGEVLLAQEDEEAALVKFRHALEIWPQHREARRRIEQLGG